MVVLMRLRSRRQIAEIALLKLSDVRTLLARLHEANIIELQQIPRGTERAAQRMIFFWHIDLSRTYGSLLSSFYKTLANLAQRRAAELERRQALLDRANRTDVKNDLSLLSERDRKELGEMHEVLVQIALAEMRTELNVFVLRDLPGGPPSTRWVWTRARAWPWASQLTLVHADPTSLCSEAPHAQALLV